LNKLLLISARGSGGALQALSVGSGAEPTEKKKERRRRRKKEKSFLTLGVKVQKDTTKIMFSCNEHHTID